MITLITNIFTTLLMLMQTVFIKNNSDKYLDIFNTINDTCNTQAVLPNLYNDSIIDYKIISEFNNNIWILLIAIVILIILGEIIKARFEMHTEERIIRNTSYEVAEHIKRNKDKDQQTLSIIQNDIQQITEEIKDIKMSISNIKNEIYENKYQKMPDEPIPEVKFEEQPKIEEPYDIEKEYEIDFNIMKAENISEDWNKKASGLWKFEETKDCKCLRLKFNYHGTEIIYCDNNPYTKELCSCFASLFEIGWETRNKEICPIEYIYLHQLLHTTNKINWWHNFEDCIGNNLDMNLCIFNILPIINKEDRCKMTEMIYDYLRKMESLYLDYIGFKEEYEDAYIDDAFGLSKEILSDS